MQLCVTWSSFFFFHSSFLCFVQSLRVSMIRYLRASTFLLIRYLNSSHDLINELAQIVFDSHICQWTSAPFPLDYTSILIIFQKKNQKCVSQCLHIYFYLFELKIKLTAYFNLGLEWTYRKRHLKLNNFKLHLSDVYFVADGFIWLPDGLTRTEMVSLGV